MVVFLIWLSNPILYFYVTLPQLYMHWTVFPNSNVVSLPIFKYSDVLDFIFVRAVYRSSNDHDVNNKLVYSKNISSYTLCYVVLEAFNQPHFLSQLIFFRKHSHQVHGYITLLKVLPSNYNSETFKSASPGFELAKFRKFIKYWRVLLKGRGKALLLYWPSNPEICLEKVFWPFHNKNLVFRPSGKVF